MKIRVIHKGTAFLLLILLLQVGLFVQFFRLVRQAEEFAERERQERQLSDAVTDISALLSDAMLTVAHKFTGGPADTIEDPADIKKRMDAVFARTDGLLLKFPQFRVPLVQLKQLCITVCVLTKEVSRVPSDASVFAKADAFMSYKEAIMGRFRDIDRIKLLLNDLRAQLTADAKAELAARQRLKQQISWGMIAEIVITISFIIAFFVDITKRLDDLVKNAQAIPTGGPLPVSIGGSDELAFLDQVLHQSSLALRRAAEYRQSLMSMVAHDLRIPLMASRLSVENMLQENPQDQRARTLKQQMNRLIGLVEDLLTLEKLEGGRLELNYDVLDIRQTLDVALEDLATVATNKNIRFQISVEHTNLPADRNRIIQVWTNLLSNAIKFSPPDSVITVDSRAENGMLRLAVKDRGPGIADENQAKLFEKFYQLHDGDQAQGFGLGLAICKLIVTAHGGAVGAISALQSGSEFWFALPLSLDDEDENVDA